MSENPKEYSQDEESLAVDPPNNTDPGASLSSSDNEPLPVDPPNNT